MKTVNNLKAFTIGAICMALACSIALNIVLINKSDFAYTAQQQAMMDALVEDVNS